MKESLYVVWLVIVYSATGIKNMFVNLGTIIKIQSRGVLKTLKCEDCNFLVCIILLSIFTYCVLVFNLMGFTPYILTCLGITGVFIWLLGRVQGFYILVLVLGMLIGLVVFAITVAVDSERFDSVGVVEYTPEKVFKNKDQDDVMSVDVNGKIIDLKVPKECRYTSLEFIVSLHTRSVNVRPDLQNYVLLCNNEKVQAVIDEKVAKRVVKMEPLTDK